MRKKIGLLQAACLVMAVLWSSPAGAQTENWPRWRGPRNDGTSAETGIAAKWSKAENVNWRLELPGPAPSTPIIWRDRIFLTSAEGASLVFLCANTSGKELWKNTHGKNPQPAPSRLTSLRRREDLFNGCRRNGDGGQGGQTI